MNPAMASSLSSVPPVWPRPRPAACGTAAPQAITTGTSGMVILSPTPPVECLSTNASGLPSRRRSPKSNRSPESIMAAVQRAISAGRHAAQEDRHQQRRHLLVVHPAVGVAVDHPVDRGIRQHAAVALGPDDGRSIECELRHGVLPARPDRRGRTRRAADRPAGAGPPDGRSACSGPPCSSSTCRHRPHGMSKRRRWRPHTTARRAGRHRRNAGRRPQHTRHRDLGHMRHSPHCSRPRFDHRRSAPPPRPGTASTARRPAPRPQSRCPATTSSRHPMVMSAPPPGILNAFRSLRFAARILRQATLTSRLEGLLTGPR